LGVALSVVVETGTGWSCRSADRAGKIAAVSDGCPDRAAVMLSLQAALLDRVTPELRAVGVRWSEREIRAWFLYDVEALAQDGCTAELVSLAETDVMADFDVDVRFTALALPRPAVRRFPAAAVTWVYARFEDPSVLHSTAGAPLRRLVSDYRAGRLAAEPFCRLFTSAYEAQVSALSERELDAFSPLVELIRFIDARPNASPDHFAGELILAARRADSDLGLH
jgi:hypothetical protein